MQKYIIIFLLTPLFIYPGKNKISPAPTASVYRLFVDTEYLPKETGEPSLENAMLRGDEKMYLDLRQGGLNPTNDNWLSVLQYKTFQDRALMVKAYNVLRVNPNLIVPEKLANYLCGFGSYRINKYSDQVRTQEFDMYYTGALYGLPGYLTRYLKKRLWYYTSQNHYGCFKAIKDRYHLLAHSKSVIPLGN